MARFNKGFTLLEMLMVIGLVGVIGVTSFLLYSKVSGSVKGNDDAEFVVSAMGKMIDAASALDTFQDFGSATTTINNGLRDSGIIPSGRLNGNNVVNGKGSLMIFSNNENEMVSGKSFKSMSITSNGYTSIECNAYANKVATLFDRVVVNGNIVKDFNTQFNVAATAAACNVNSSSIVTTYLKGNTT